MNKATKQPNPRHKEYKAIHTALGRLGYSDDQYRDILAAQYGVSTAKALSLPQLRELKGFLLGKVNRLKKQTDSNRPNTSPDKQGLINKIEAMLAEKGKAEGKYIPWSYAHSILFQQYRVKRLEWATTAQLSGVISALHRDAVRHGRRVK